MFKLKTEQCGKPNCVQTIAIIRSLRHISNAKIMDNFEM